jgi:DNA-binding response OmpR family regulator
LELDEMKNKLYTNITHEFRTPLTLIHGPIAHALTAHEPLDESSMKSMYHQSRRLQQLITQMLDLQKAEAGKLKPNYVYGNVVDAARNAYDAFSSLAKEKEVTLRFSASEPNLEMDYDDEKLTQILTNLVANAIRHTPSKGTVSLTLSCSDGNLFIQVHDTGTGISEQDLPFIFDRYYQSSRAAQGGTGIGLALAKNLVELLKGSISVTSNEKIGTSFQISLPVTHTARASGSSPAQRMDIVFNGLDDETRFSAPSDITSDKPIVLVVEDHTDVAQFSASCLRKDYSTVIASDGETGIKKAFEHIPDLVISDVMMPGIDGFEVCARIKTDIQTSHIPVILLTGRGDHAALMEGIEHGADAYVVKPFEPAELLLRVKKLLELRRILSEHYRNRSNGIIKPQPTQASAREHAFVEKLRTFIEEHINDPQLSMHMLCQHMAMSHPQLHRKITALTGESAGKLVRSVRLTKALDLLRNSDLTVSEIAYETGFSEPGYFTKVFSKEYAMTPTEYRASM